MEPSVSAGLKTAMSLTAHLPLAARLVAGNRPVVAKAKYARREHAAHEGGRCRSERARGPPSTPARQHAACLELDLEIAGAAAQDDGPRPMAVVAGFGQCRDCSRAQRVYKSTRRQARSKQQQAGGRRQEAQPQACCCLWRPPAISYPRALGSRHRCLLRLRSGDKKKRKNAPVVYALLVVDFEAETSDEGGRRPGRPRRQLPRMQRAVM